MLLKTRQRGFCADRFCSIDIGGAMLGGAAIGGITGLLGADKASDASKDASKMQWDMYNQTRTDLNPYYQSGLNAMNTYNDALGLGGSYANQPMGIGDWNALNPAPQSLPGSTSNDGFSSQFTQGSGFRQYIDDLQRKSAPQNDGYQNYLNSFDSGEYTPNERQQSPMYGPFNPPAGSDLPTYTPGEDLPTYSATAGPEAYQSKGDFQFNLEDDPIYQFSRDEGLRAATRQMNAQKMSNSGNILDELQRRGTGIAAQYQNDAFNRQLAGSSENYGRGVQDYSINDARNRDIYGRNVQDYGLDATRNNQMFNRNISNYGIDTDYSNALYGRGVGEYGLDVARNQDIYGRDENYLNRLANLSGSGQNAAAQLGGFGAQAAGAAGQYGMQGGLAEAQGLYNIGSTGQGSIANYLNYDLMQNNPYLFANGYGNSSWIGED